MLQSLQLQNYGKVGYAMVLHKRGRGRRPPPIQPGHVVPYNQFNKKLPQKGKGAPYKFN